MIIFKTALKVCVRNNESPIEISFSRLEPVVTGTVGLLVVSPPVLSLGEIVLYNHENFTEIVAIIGGSGHFDYRLIQPVNVTIIRETLNSKIKVSTQ